MKLRPLVLFAATVLLGIPGLPAQAAAPNLNSTSCTLSPLGSPCININTDSAIIQHPEILQTIPVEISYLCKTEDGTGSMDLNPHWSMQFPLRITCDGEYQYMTANVAAFDVGPERVTAVIPGASAAAWITAMPALPDAVASMSLSKATTNTMVVTWTHPAPRPTMTNRTVEDTTITGYKIGWTEASTGRKWESQAPHYSLDASPLTLTGLIPNTSYDVYVIPVNVSGDGAATHRTMSTLTPPPVHPRPPVKKHAAWQSFNVSPEPAVKGRALTVRGLLLADGHDLATWVSIQFKANGARSYTTIKRTTVDGHLGATVTAQRSGTWRAVYSGSSTVTSATSAGDYVRVIPKR